MASTKKTSKKRAATKAAHASKDKMVTGLTFLFVILSLIFAGIACYYYV